MTANRWPEVVKMKLHRRDLLLMLAAGVVLPPVRAADPPALELAKTYHPGLDLREFWVSEKLDGVRDVGTGGNCSAVAVR